MKIEGARIRESQMMVPDQLKKDKSLLKNRSNQKYKSQLMIYYRTKQKELKQKGNKLFLIYQVKEAKAEEMLNLARIETDLNSMNIRRFQICRKLIKDLELQLGT